MYLKSVERSSFLSVSDMEGRWGPSLTSGGAATRGMLDHLRGFGQRMLGLNRQPVEVSPRPSATALLYPARPGLFTIWERRAIAAFAAILSGHARQAQYIELLADSQKDATGLGSEWMSGSDLSQAVLAEAHRLLEEPPAQARYRMRDQLRERLGDRLATALEHTWRRLRQSAPDEALTLRLSRAGWTDPEIREMDQIIALLKPRSPAWH
ncbi:MAG: hypothetical protein QM682_03770 [Paracoccus sp. (in: a-proteobacteria)]|uniref:hypothetical protein n=1 Tax=Paracoccus sp. TaxID=267 RepID=UPI0039E5B296